MDDAMARPSIIFAVFAAMASASFAASVAESQSAEFVFLQPEKTALWRTAPGTSVTVAIPYPPGTERTARLSVSGYRHSATYSVKDVFAFTLELPEPGENRPDRENVYDLVLEFADGSVKTARIGGIAGFDGSSEGTTRCLLSRDDSRWNTVKRSAVLPIPYGTENITVNGTETDTGLAGAAGWFLLAPLSGGTSYNLAVDGASAVLNAYADGTVLVFR
jgi:hypothetical protein